MPANLSLAKFVRVSIQALVFGLVVLVSACGQQEQTVDEAASFELGELLGGDDTEGFTRAIAPRQFSFPADHGPHAGYRNEWWYITGNLRTEQNRRFGYQVTFFNTAIRPQANNSRDPAASAWQSNHIWMAHVALTDQQGQQHYSEQRFARENPGLAGAQLEPFKVWLEDWQLTEIEFTDQTAGNNVDATMPWALLIRQDDFTLQLELNALKPPVLQGVAGLSQKSPEPGNASYYYSQTRLSTIGSVLIHDEQFAVTGTSWLDREWSTSALAADQTGWDWFSLQFDDGQELMYYQLRDRAGQTHASSQGNWTTQQAEQILISPQDIVLEELENWTSPSGVTYTTAWELAYGGGQYRIEAIVDEQLMTGIVEYWEGAVDIIDLVNNNKVGQGYLEMVRQDSAQ